MNFEVYCDESRQELFSRAANNGFEKFVLIGGVWIEADHRENLKAKITQLRQQHNLHGEFKWTRVSPSRLVFYKDLIDLFFGEPIRFRCIVLPASKMDAFKFHDGDNELMFYKFYYLMLRGWIFDFNQYQIFTDLRTNRAGNRLGKLHQMLSQANRFAEVSTVQALPSEQVDMLQLADVLLGSVSYKFNSSGRSAAKLSLIEHIETQLKRSIDATSKAEEKFNVFKWRPGGGW